MKRILSARGVRGAVNKKVAYNHLAYIREIVDRIYVNGFDLFQSHFFIMKNIGGIIMNGDKDEIQRCAEKYNFFLFIYNNISDENSKKEHEDSKLEKFERI